MQAPILSALKAYTMPARAYTPQDAAQLDLTCLFGAPKAPTTY